MPRRMKSPATPAITSLDELVLRVGRFGALSAEIEGHVARANEQIAAIKANLETATAPMAAEMKAILKAAKPWWAANADQLTDGKRKSVELAGCLVGERLSKPALAYPKPEYHAVNLIEGRAWAALLRVKKELDKPAILKALAYQEPGTDDGGLDALIDELEAVEIRDTLRALGFGVDQKEEFFIARLAELCAQTEAVADPDHQVTA